MVSNGLTKKETVSFSTSLLIMEQRSTLPRLQTATPLKMPLRVVQVWINWAGPPVTLIADSAPRSELKHSINSCKNTTFKLRTIAPEAHWQNSRAERLQAILNKMDQDKPVQTLNDLETALSFATQTKTSSRLSTRTASVSSEGSEASNESALRDPSEGVQFRLAIREAARKAFCEVDHTQSLRRAVRQRSRPQRTIFHPRDWIVARRKEKCKNFVWAVLGNKLFRAAPVHARPLSAVEEIRRAHKIQHQS